MKSTNYFEVPGITILWQAALRAAFTASNGAWGIKYMNKLQPAHPRAPHSNSLKLMRTSVGAMEVSVIIPAFNAADTIVRAIDSVRSQNTPSLEIIVIDDGSVDDTVNVVRSCIRAGENIQLIKMPKNSGVSAARNAGIKVARGKFLAFLDADDIWLPEKLRKQIEVMEQGSADYARVMQ